MDESGLRSHDVYSIVAAIKEQYMQNRMSWSYMIWYDSASNDYHAIGPHGDVTQFTDFRNAVRTSMQDWEDFQPANEFKLIQMGLEQLEPWIQQQRNPPDWICPCPRLSLKVRRLFRRLYRAVRRKSD